MIKFEDLPYRAQMLSYLKITFEHDSAAIFCTSNKELHKAGEILIAEGLVIELENPECVDRYFGLTDVGKTHLISFK